jgi:hypothetical protein
MIRQAFSILLTEMDQKYIEEFIKNNPIINTFPKFISHAVNQYIKILKSKENDDCKDN